MININYRDTRPIYEQIKEGLKKQLAVGVIGPDEKLPSVRDLAAELSINPNTIQRAYRELEAEGYIYSVAGRGSFACASHEIDNRHRSELLDKLDQIVKEFLDSGISKDEIIERINQLYNNH